MSRVLKILLSVVVLVVVVAAGLLGYVVFAIDPNDYKPQIEQAAAKQGVDLQIDGELGWSLFPGLGLEVGGIRVESETHRIRPSSLQSAELNLALMPLLQKRLVIEALTVNGADIQLDQGDRHMSSVAATPVAATTEISGEQSGLPFSLAIDKLELNDSKITLHKADGSATVIEDISLSSLGVNTAGKTTPISVSLQYPLGDKKVKLSAEGKMAYDQDSGKVNIPRLDLSVENLVGAPLTASLGGHADLTAGTAEIQLDEGDLAGISVNGDVGVTGLNDELELRGELDANSANLRKSLETLTGNAIATGDPEALKSLILQVGFTGSAEKVTLKPLALGLDDTAITGEGQLTLGESPNLQLNLKGDSIDLDRYQAPKSAEQESSGTTVEGDEALLAPLAGIVALLDGGLASIDLAFDRIAVAGTDLGEPKAKIRARGDTLSLSPIEFAVYDGKFNSTVAIDMGNQPPSLTFNLALANIDIAAAQQQWTENTDLSGRLTLNMQGSTRGETTEQLLDQLAASGNLAADDLHLASVNLEKSYCEIAQLVERNPPREESWPEGTDLNAVASQFTIEGRTIRLQNYVTGVGNLKVRGQGAIDLKQEAFDIDVIANLTGDRTSENGCVIKSKRIRNRDIPFECRDSFAGAGPSSCKPDQGFVEDMLKGEVLDKLLPKGEDGEEKPFEGLLRGLLNQ